MSDGSRTPFLLLVCVSGNFLVEQLTIKVFLTASWYRSSLLFCVSVGSVLSLFKQWLLGPFQQLQALLSIICRLFFLPCPFHVAILPASILSPVLFSPYKLPLRYHIYPHDLCCYLDRSESQTLCYFSLHLPFLELSCIFLKNNGIFHFEILKSPYSLCLMSTSTFLFPLTLLFLLYSPS